MICPPNQLTKKNTFLNLEFRNEKLENINLVIPLNEISLSRLIEKNNDWIQYKQSSILTRDTKKTTIYNFDYSKIEKLKAKNLVSKNLNFMEIDKLLLAQLTKKSLPFVEKVRQNFFQGKTSNVVWQWFDLKSSTKGFVTYNNENEAKFIIITIDQKIFNQNNFL